MAFFVFQEIETPTNPLPIFLIQVLLTLILTRILGKLLSYIKQPQVIGEMIGGIIMGPSILGLIPNYTKTIWPDWSLNTFNVIANLGLIFFMFLMGLEVQPEIFRKVYKKSLPIALASIIFPFGIGVALSFWLYEYNNEVSDPPTNKNRTGFILFIGTSMSFTAFPVLASLLESKDLLNTTIGVQSLSMASVNDLLAWCLLALASSFVASENVAEGAYIFVLAMIYVVGMMFIIKPIISKIHQHFLLIDQEDNAYFRALILFILISSALTTQVIGIHAFFGSFLAGLIIPKENGNLTNTLIPKIELLTKTILLPLYFVSSGIKTDIRSLKTGKDIEILVIVLILAVLVKFIPSCLLTKLLMRKFPWGYCFSIGFLMNTRGLVELIALNVGLNTHILSIELFTIFVLMAIITTVMTSPFLACFYKREYDNIHEHDTIQRSVHNIQTNEVKKIETNNNNNNNNNEMISNSHLDIISNNIQIIYQTANSEIRTEEMVRLEV